MTLQPLSTVFSASAVLDEANLLSLLTELLTLHHDAIPCISGNVQSCLIYRFYKGSTILSRTELKTCGPICSLDIFRNHWFVRQTLKSNSQRTSLFHVTFGSGPCRRDGQRRGSCAGPAAFVMEKLGSRKSKNMNKQQIIQPQVVAFKLCSWFPKFAMDIHGPRIGF